jgi:hypothetical protein
MAMAIRLAAAISVLLILILLWRLSRRKKPKAWIQETICSSCGWRGQTSRYAGRCPRCNTPIGDQKGKLRP